MEVHSGADVDLQPVEDPMLEQVVVPEEGRDSEGSLHWSSSSLGGLQPAGGTHAGAVHEELQPVGRTHIEKFVEDCLL